MFVLTVTHSAYAQDPTSPKEVGRYVLLSGTAVVIAEGTDREGKPRVASEKVPVVLKIDTVTGKTWQLDIGVYKDKSRQAWTPIDE